MWITGGAASFKQCSNSLYISLFLSPFLFLCLSLNAMSTDWMFMVSLRVFVYYFYYAWHKNMKCNIFSLFICLFSICINRGLYSIQSATAYTQHLESFVKISVRKTLTKLKKVNFIWNWIIMFAASDDLTAMRTYVLLESIYYEIHI